MTTLCHYCNSSRNTEDPKCQNCGAPSGPEPGINHRICPHCRRKLLTLGSPTCNYCGRALPLEYVRTREGILNRLTTHQPDKKDNDWIQEALKRGDSDGRISFTEILDLTDLF